MRRDGGGVERTYKVLHDIAPRYVGPLDRVADLPGRRALYAVAWWCRRSDCLRSKLRSSRSFSVSAPRIWNALPEDVVCFSAVTINIPASTLNRLLPSIIARSCYHQSGP